MNSRICDMPPDERFAEVDRLGHAFGTRPVVVDAKGGVYEGRLIGRWVGPLMGRDVHYLVIELPDRSKESVPLGQINSIRLAGAD